MRPAEKVALEVMSRQPEIVGRTPLRPTIFAESVAISGEALFIAMLVLVVLAIVGIAGIAALVYLGAYLGSRFGRSRTSTLDGDRRGRLIAVWLWVLCTVASAGLMVALPAVWFVGLPAALALGAAGAAVTERIDERP